MAFQSDDISINTMIGAGTFVNGILRVEGFVRIDGCVDGNVETTGRIIIGENAKIRGSVKAKAVITGGIIEGDVIAPEGVQLFSSSVVLGDIISRRIKAEKNSIIQGYCISVDDESSFDELKDRWIDKRAVVDKNFFGKD